MLCSLSLSTTAAANCPLPRPLLPTTHSHPLPSSAGGHPLILQPGPPCLAPPPSQSIRDFDTRRDGWQYYDSNFPMQLNSATPRHLCGGVMVQPLAAPYASRWGGGGGEPSGCHTGPVASVATASHCQSLPLAPARPSAQRCRQTAQQQTPPQPLHGVSNLASKPSPCSPILRKCAAAAATSLSSRRPAASRTTPTPWCARGRPPL